MSTNTSNIVVFGASGVGKSSVIKMIMKQYDSKDIPIVGHSANPCTFQSDPYQTNTDGMVLWDTVGLSDGLDKKTSFNHAVIKLYQLLENLAGGVSLLLLVDRGPRITDSTIRNYKMFHEIFCRKQVPIVLVLTGMEGQKTTWWGENKDILFGQGLEFKGQASVVANVDPPNPRHLEELCDLLKHRGEPCKTERVEESKILVEFYNYLAPIFGWGNDDTPLTKALRECGKVTKKEAKVLQRYAKLDKEIQTFKHVYMST